MAWEHPSVAYRVSRRTSEFRKRANDTAAVLIDHPAFQSEVEGKVAMLWGFGMPMLLFDTSCSLAKGSTFDLRRLVSMVPRAGGDALFTRSLVFSIALILFIPHFREEFEKSPSTALVTVLWSTFMEGDVDAVSQLAESFVGDFSQAPIWYWTFLFRPWSEPRNELARMLDDPMPGLEMYIERETIRGGVFGALCKLAAEPINNMYLERRVAAWKESNT